MNSENVDIIEHIKRINSETGFVDLEQHRKNGKLHKEDGPANIVRLHDENGEFEQVEEWFINGIRMRLDGGPAIVKRYMPHDQITFRGYFKDGNLVRELWNDDLPEPG